MAFPRAFVLAACAGVNAILYPLLLPLWEGWDEPFHYAYVQTLSTEGRVPRLGDAPVSREVMRSLRLAPASHVVRRNLPYVTTFDEFARKPAEERRALRRELEAIPPASRGEAEPGTNNYEAQQAPLAYLPLAALDRAAAGWSLMGRVLLLRIIGALAAAALQFWAVWRLAGSMGLDEMARGHALFWVLASQMFYATAARVSNDWLALPLATGVVVSLVEFHAAPGRRRAVWLGLLLGLGLLTKAYFLAFVPVALALVAWKRRGWEALAAMAVLAGPWYARNVALYGSVSGMQQTASGVGLAEVLRAVPAMPWAQVLQGWLRGALWTGNNSFTTFSARTLDVILVLIAVGLGAWWVKRRAGGEAVAAAAVAVFAAALLYSTAVFYAHTADGSVSATPWYAQAVAAPVAVLAALGYSRLRWGAWALAALSALAAYLLAATYWVKLIPLYGGYGGGAARAGALAGWYSGSGGEWRAVLADTIPGPVGAVLGLAAAAAGLGVLAAVLLARTRGGEGG